MQGCAVCRFSDQLGEAGGGGAAGANTSIHSAANLGQVQRPR